MSNKKGAQRLFQTSFRKLHIKHTVVINFLIIHFGIVEQAVPILSRTSPWPSV